MILSSIVVMEFSSENVKNAPAVLVLMGEGTHYACPDHYIPN
jgi:hypothetical protein